MKYFPVNHSPIHLYNVCVRTFVIDSLAAISSMKRGHFEQQPLLEMSARLPLNTLYGRRGTSENEQFWSWTRFSTLKPSVSHCFPNLGIPVALCGAFKQSQPNHSGADVLWGKRVHCRGVSARVNKDFTRRFEEIR